MTSPYRSQHIFSPTSPGTRHKHIDTANTSVNIATAINNSKRGGNYNSYYASPSNKHSRVKPVDVLDIRSIDHEAIKNDPELRKLSRNPAAFNASLFDDSDQEDEAYYDEYDEDDGSIDDTYADVELLVNNPIEEHRLRMLASQSSSLSNQNVPGTPKRISSVFSTTDDYNNEIDGNKEIDNYRRACAKNSNTNTKSTWKESIIDLFFRALRICVFQIFMIYWIVKESIIRIVTFFTMMVSTFFVDPTIYLWSHLPNNQNWIPSLERRKQITSWCTLIVFISLSVSLLPYMKPYLPTSLPSISLPTLHIPQQLKQQQQLQSNPDLAAIIQSISSVKSDQSKIWTTLEKMQSDDGKKWSKLDENWKKVESSQSQFGLKNKKMWSEFQSFFESEHGKLWSEVQSENAKIWSTLEDHQSQIDAIRRSLDKDIRNAIENQLPDMILVRTNQDGELELSPQFYAYLQDSSFWDSFLQNNEESIKKYFAGEMTVFFEQQQKQGAVIGKDAFMKLLSSALMQHQHGTSQHMDVSLDGLIESAISKYHQDVLNTADFALISRGARIIYSVTTSTHYPLPAWLQSVRQAAGLSTVTNEPEMAISPQTHVGECWYMYGSQGSLGIALSQPVMIQGITVEYPSAEVMMNKMDSAPKDMEVFGIKNFPNQSKELVSLGSIKYDIHKDASIQTFDLNMNPADEFSAVLIRIKSNWGNKDHTDIYRIRIHGIPV